MAASLRHRGPDDSGIWFDPEAGVGLASRRLAVQDLSDRGHQPMVSQDGRFRLVYNGEVYNFPELRRELEARGASFQGRSDTEVILAAVSAWGLRDALARLNGMFALALWDLRKRRLHLARDPFGEKPLYHGAAAGGFAFASELRALRALLEVSPAVDRGALALLMRLGYIPAPSSIYRGIGKLRPGAILTVDPAAPHEGRELLLGDAGALVEEAASRPLSGSPDELTQRLEARLEKAVARRMLADVPVGAFLSGGIDSSAVVALMQARSSRPIKTFTVGFRESAFDEAPGARAVAQHLGCDHSELVVDAAQALSLIPQLPEIYDEPFADPSQIPTCLVAGLARRQVTVCLAGDGGDEIFGGYGRYLEAERLWRALGWLPPGLRRGLAGLLHGLAGRLGGPGSAKLARLAELAPAPSPEVLYQGLMSDPESVVVGAEAAPISPAEPIPPLRRLKHRLMYRDLVTYLPDDILVKLDRATMAVGLEGRLPLLDPDVVELAWRLPLHAPWGGESKWLLRRILARYLPEALIAPAKRGFELPLADWLRGPLRPWAEELLEPGRLKREGYLRPGIVERRWREHLEGRRDRRFFLWRVLMAQQWLQLWA